SGCWPQEASTAATRTKHLMPTPTGRARGRSAPCPCAPVGLAGFQTKRALLQGESRMDFDLTERQAHFRDRVRDFIDRHVRPRQQDYHREIATGDRWQPLRLIEDMKPLARQAGLWNLFMPPGGALQHVDDSFAFEEIG